MALSNYERRLSTSSTTTTSSGRNQQISDDDYAQNDFHDSMSSQNGDSGGSRLWKNLIGLVRRVSASPVLAGLVSKGSSGSTGSLSSSSSSGGHQFIGSLASQWQEEISILIDSLCLINNIFQALTSGFIDSPAKNHRSQAKTDRQKKKVPEHTQQDNNSTLSEDDDGQDSEDQDEEFDDDDYDDIEDDQHLILHQQSELFYDALEELNPQHLLSYFEDVEPKLTEQLRILEQQSNKFRKKQNSIVSPNSSTRSNPKPNKINEDKNESKSSYNNDNIKNDGTCSDRKMVAAANGNQISTVSIDNKNNKSMMAISNETAIHHQQTHITNRQNGRNSNSITPTKSSPLTTRSSNHNDRGSARATSSTSPAANNNTMDIKCKRHDHQLADDQDYESANENSFNEVIAAPTNKIYSTINKTTKPTSVNNLPLRQKSPTTTTLAAKHNNNIIKQASQSQTSLSSTTSSTASITSSNSNHNNNMDNKIKRPNFIVINKSATSNRNTGTIAVNKQNEVANVKELSRGNKQRASTSSCSSSDSYGSGYASGSGNSTDHEQKEKLKRDNLSSLQSDDHQVAAAMDENGDEDDNEDEDVEESTRQQEITPTQLEPKLNMTALQDDNDANIDYSSEQHRSKSLISSTSISPKTTTAFKSPILSSSPVTTSYNKLNPSQSMQTSSANGDGAIDDINQTRKKPITGQSLSSSSTKQSQSKSNIITGSTMIDSQQTSSLSSDKQEPYYHTLFQWEQLVSKGVTRPLLINDLDFTDLRDEDDCDLLNSGQQSNVRNHKTGELLHIKIPDHQRNAQDQIDSGTSSGPNTGSPRDDSTPVNAPPPMPPPPMSPWFNTISGSRPQSQLLLSPTPSSDVVPQSQSEAFNREDSPVDSTYSGYSRNSFCVPHTSTPTQELSNTNIRCHQFNTLQTASSLRSASSMSSLLFGSNGKYGSKRKKTMKLFWKEVREDRSLLSKLTKKKTIWDEIKPVPIDTQKLEYLFESKAKDLSLSRSRNGLDAMSQRKAKITVLDTKRSNAINIGMTKLPPMRTIKSAILKMDSNIMNREGIEKILTTMMPTEEEKSRIIEAQLANPETPLGTAEQFLLNLASISALEARLKLWAFQLDYAQIEKEVAEPLMDLKQAIEEIEQSETFRLILGTLLSIGNFLNCSNVKGFQIDYLEKVPEVKDTVHKHSLLHHLCVFMQERYEHTSDLYSEFSAVNRASKIDYVEVGKNLKKMQQDCKASWDYLKIVAKHDGLANLMNTSSASISSTNNVPSGAGSSSQTSSSSPSSIALQVGSNQHGTTPVNKPCGKLNNLSKLSMITTITSSDSNNSGTIDGQQQQHHTSASNSSNTTQTTPSSKQMKTKVSDFLTDCAERIMVLMVIHRRVMNRFQKLLVYLGCPSHQIKQTQPQQVLKVINEFALEYRTKRERVREMILKRQQCQHNHYLQQNAGSRWQLNRSRWAGSQQLLDSNNRPCSTASSYANNPGCPDLSCCDTLLRNHSGLNGGQGMVRNGACRWADSPYGDYLYNDQGSTYCQSRQQSETPVQSDAKRLEQNLMSASMFDLQNQNQQQQKQQQLHDLDVGYQEAGNIKDHHQINGSHNRAGGGDDICDPELIQQRKKDEQLCRLLGVGKSFDGACSDLLKMSHWTTTSQRVVRHQPVNLQKRKQRAASIDCQSNDDQFEESIANDRRQSWQNSSRYRNSFNQSGGGSCIDDDLGQNSDEELMHCLVRHANSSSRNNSVGNIGSNGGGGARLSSNYGQPLRGKLVARDSHQ